MLGSQMLGHMLKDDEVVFPIWEWRKLVIQLTLFYFVLCLVIGYLGMQWWSQRQALETWRVAYCRQSARLFVAQYPQTLAHLNEDLADCNSQ